MMTITEALAKARADCDGIVQRALDDHAEFLRAHGATEPEVEAELKIRWAELDAWRDGVMAKAATEIRRSMN